MATQIKVNSSTGNITVQLGRGVIGPSTTANVANTAYNLDAAGTPNVVIGGGVNGYVLSTNGAGVTSWVAQTGGGGSVPGGANTQIQYNDAGTMQGDTTFTFNNTTDVVSASHFSGEAGNLSNIQGANVSGAVANASHAVISNSANLVAVANVTGIGNIATVNLDGNAANFLDGTGSFGPAGAGSQTLADVLTTGNTSSGTGITMSTTDKISFNDAQVNVHSSSDGTLNADADVEIQLQAPYIDLAAANVNMDGNLTITGMFTGDAGGASNIVGANVTGAVPFATTANAVALANVSGAGNIASINLDGNAANYVSGTGVWGPISAGTATEIANGTSNVNIAVADGPITVGVNGVADIFAVKSSGANVKSALYVDGTNGNVLIQPNVAVNGKTYSSVVRGEYNIATANSTTGQAFVTDSYTTQGVTDIQTFANTAAGAIAKGPSLSFNNYAAIGNTSTDPLVAGQIDFFANPDAANLAKADTTTGTSMTMGGFNTDGFLINVGATQTDAYGSEVWKQFQYRPKSMGFIRRGGNGDSRASPVANDETSLNFYTTQTLGGTPGSLYNWPAKMGSKVDPGWTDPNLGSKGTPEGLFFTVVTEDFANLEHRMFANGDTIFNTAGGGTPITLGYNGVITGDGGGLSNISSSAGSKIINGTSNVDIGSLNGNVTVGVGGVGDVLKLTTTGANVTGTLNATGIITGDGSGLSALTGANVTGQVPFAATANAVAGANVTGAVALATDATTANSVALANVVGAGNIASINLDGNVANFLTGLGTFAPASGGAVQAQIANGTSNINIPAVNGNIDTTVNGNTVIVTTDVGAVIQNQPAGNITISPSLGSAYNEAGYQSEQYQPSTMALTRRNGNSTNQTASVSGDETSIDFYNTQPRFSNPATRWNYPAKMGSKVDPGWVAPNDASTGVPQGLFFNAVNTGFANIEHRMYGNGEVAFNTTGGGTPVKIGYNGVITGDGGGLSNVSATATPGGFNDTIQFNNGGTLAGNSSFQFIPGSNPQVQLNGTASSSDVGQLQLQNSILDIYTENMSGGFTPMSFSTYNSGGFIDPINYYRARGTRAAPAAVISGDIVKNQRNQAFSGAGATLAYAGGESSTIQANDGTGNLAVTTTISTAKPANGPNSLDKIDLDTEFVTVHGNIQMDNTNASFIAGRIRQTADIFNNLTASPVTGERAVITDGPGYNSFGTVVSAGGGSSVMPVFWDGSAWRMG